MTCRKLVVIVTATAKELWNIKTAKHGTGKNTNTETTSICALSNMEIIDKRTTSTYLTAFLL